MPDEDQAFLPDTGAAGGRGSAGHPATGGREPQAEGGEPSSSAGSGASVSEGSGGLPEGGTAGLGQAGTSDPVPTGGAGVENASGGAPSGGQGGTGNDGGTSSGGSESGGTSSGGSPTGGSPTGGASSGGSESGGTSSGGSPTGGTDSGGAGTGGTDSGGAGTGGTDSGGSPTGGTDSGGSAGTAGFAGAAGDGGGFDPDAGLVSHFPFDELDGTTCYDRLNVANTAILMGGTTRTDGRFLRAVRMRNSPTVDWVTLPQGLLSTLSTTTIVFWFRDLSVERKGARLFDVGTDNYNHFFVVPDDVNPSTSMAGNHLGGLAEGSGLPFVDLWGTESFGTVWNQIAISWSADSIDWYWNSALVGSQLEPGVIPSDLGATTQNFFGRSVDDLYERLYGEVDDLRIYDRVLPQTEIELLYAMP